MCHSQSMQVSVVAAVAGVDTTHRNPQTTGRAQGLLVLSDDERVVLTRWTRRQKSSQALAMRARIVLACADGTPNTHVAARLGVSRDMVGTWRSRFVARRLEGLSDEPRPGAPRKLTDDVVEAVIVKTLEQTP